METSYFADMGVLGLCLMACVWLVVFSQNEKKKYEDARHRAISSALKDGERVVLSLGVIGNYPHRIAIDGRVWGFSDIGDLLNFLMLNGSGESRSECAREWNGVLLTHPSI
jgi:hypothetical protein